MRRVVAEILAESDSVGGPAAADEVIVIMIGATGQCAVVKGDIAFEVESLDGASFGVDVEPVAELIEEDVVPQQLCSVLVLSVNAVAVAAIFSRALPAVMINQAAIDFGIGRGAPGPDSDTSVMDDQVNALGIWSQDVDAGAPRARAIGRRTHDLESPIPGPRAFNGKSRAVASSTINSGAPAGELPKDNGFARVTGEAAGERARIGPAVKPNGVTGTSRGAGRQGPGETKWFFCGAAGAREAGGGDVKVSRGGSCDGKT